MLFEDLCVSLGDTKLASCRRHICPTGKQPPQDRAHTLASRMRSGCSRQRSRCSLVSVSMRRISLLSSLYICAQYGGLWFKRRAIKWAHRRNGAKIWRIDPQLRGQQVPFFKEDPIVTVSRAIDTDREGLFVALCSSINSRLRSPSAFARDPSQCGDLILTVRWRPDVSERLAILIFLVERIIASAYNTNSLTLLQCCVKWKMFYIKVLN